VAAERDLFDHPIPDDSTVAGDAVRAGKPIRRAGADGRTIIAVPMWHDDTVVGVVEAVSAPEAPYSGPDVALVDAFARGAVAALLAPPA
jgi:hypothetical protein